MMLRWLAGAICLISLLGCNRAVSPTLSQSARPTSPGPTTSPSATPAISERGLRFADLVISREEMVLVELVVEIADTPSAQARGLMGVERMDENAGMAFLMTAPTRGSFYMKNTLISLDIAFWGDNGLIVDILEMQPCRADPCALYTPREKYVGAVETNIGVMSRHGVKVGDRVEVKPKG